MQPVDKQELTELTYELSVWLTLLSDVATIGNDESTTLSADVKALLTKWHPLLAAWKAWASRRSDLAKAHYAQTPMPVDHEAVLRQKVHKHRQDLIAQVTPLLRATGGMSSDALALETPQDDVSRALVEMVQRAAKHLDGLLRKIEPEANAQVDEAAG